MAGRIVIMLVLLVALGGCGDGDTESGTDNGGGGDAGVTFTEPGTSFEVEVGDRFEVVLESNATTGYEWSLVAVPPAEVLILVSDVYEAPDGDLVGARGLQRLTFEGTGDGATFLRLWYVRPFDDPPDPGARAQYPVVVGDGEPRLDPDPYDVDDPAAAIPDDEDAMDVMMLLALRPTDDVVVVASLFDDGDGLVLCEVLAESFPPQCPGPTVAIVNPEVVELELAEEAGVRWTDRPVFVFGRLVGDGFRVTAAATAF